MPITASLSGRLRNTSLPKSRALLPLFEAVVNSLQSIDAEHAENLGNGRIVITIFRSGQETLDDPDAESDASLAPIVGFEIKDNGEGFHDSNLDSFRTLDSEYKAKYGCRGVGRLLWLKAFDRIDVSSAHRVETGDIVVREFAFNRSDGVTDPIETAGVEDSTPGAVVRLVNFHEAYQVAAPKRTKVIARNILEHCLWYFVRPGGPPNISIVDGGTELNLQETYDEYLTDVEVGHFRIKGHTFDIAHLKLKSNAKASPTMSWCAASRVVLEENLLGSIPGLHGRLKDPAGDFMYSCYLTSDFLDGNVRQERTSFDINEDNAGTLYDDEPSLLEIREAAGALIRTYLRSYLDDAHLAGRQRVERFVDNQAPRYRPVLRHMATERLSVSPDISDRDLELLLHRQLSDIERDLILEGREVLDPAMPHTDDYTEKLERYLSKVDDVKKSDLAGYVSHRRVVLDLLDRAVRAAQDGTYAREDEVHNLIVPMRTTSDDLLSTDASNLWILDERLAFHNFLASDKSITSMPITSTTSAKEPDIASLRVLEGPVLVAEGTELPLASITVVEIKRPMRKDAGEGEGRDPIEQAQGYLERIRSGDVTTASGRPIPNSDQIPGFIYVVADLTKQMRQRCKHANLRPTQDGMGYFGYNENYRAYIEVNSFDRVLNSAKQRNRAFFDKLGFPAV